MAHVFLAAFLGCLLALTCVAVLGWQIAAFLIKRTIVAKLPEILSGAIHGMTGAAHQTGKEAHAELAELLRAAASTPPGVVPHLPTVACRCGSTIDVPSEFPIDRVAIPQGWRFRPDLDGWTCPTCDAASPSYE